MANVLITGITGMVGSHLADYVINQTDWNVFGLVRWRSPLDNINHLIPLVNDGHRMELVYGDLRDTRSLDEAVKNQNPTLFFTLQLNRTPKPVFPVLLTLMRRMSLAQKGCLAH